jgi:hypothetical protein
LIFVVLIFVLILVLIFVVLIFVLILVSIFVVLIFVLILDRDRTMVRDGSRVRWLIQRFPAGPQSDSHHPRSHRPPYDPGRSDFPSPVLTLACPRTAFPAAGRLKR